MLGIIGKRKAAPVLGLDISSTTVKLLELSHAGDRYRVESYAVASLPQDAVIEKNVNDVDGVANAIRSVVAQSRTKVKTVAAAVAGSSVITKMIDMPQGLSEDEMETQLTAARAAGTRPDSPTASVAVCERSAPTIKLTVSERTRSRCCSPPAGGKRSTPG